MDIVITVVQVLLTVVFAGVGLAKLTQPYAKLAARMDWVNDFRPEIIRLIGALEVCAAVGIIVPRFFNSLTMLTPLAGVGLALLMSGAMVTHLRRAEYRMLAGNLILLGLALLVAYGRLVGFAV